jgi:membrane-associated phospholipid phosphatase
MMTSNLNKPVDWKYKIFLLGVFAAFYSVFYIYPNFYPLTPPRHLPVMPIDKTAPLLTWTFWVYLSEYILVAVVIAVLDDWADFNSWARMNFGALFICGAFFLLYPTAYPRPVYPDEQNTFVALAMNLVASFDTANNCFPSLHVAITTITVWFFRSQGRWLFVTFSIWGLAIIVSTMTTKQHYFIDIVGGLGVTSLVVYLEPILFRKRNLEAANYAYRQKAGTISGERETIF